MLGKFYIDKVERVPLSTRLVIPVVSCKDSWALSDDLFREKLNVALSLYGFRLSNFHKKPFKAIPTELCFKKGPVGGTAREKFCLNSFLEAKVTEESGYTEKEPVYYTITKL